MSRPAPAAGSPGASRPRGAVTAADGLLLVDKPAGPTSHDVVAAVRRLAATRKVGHAGTLDPMATGLLVLGVGRATRLLTHLVGADKTYEATVRLGQETLTEDAQGEVTASAGCPAPDSWPGGGAGLARRLDDALRPLTGEIMQVPSAVSAIKVDGVRSYRRVRGGEDVALPARSVTIRALTLTGAPAGACADDGTRVVDLPLRVSCSSGTYVRALARDAGAALGVGAHLTALRRTRVGGLPLDDALTLDELTRAVEDTPTGEGEEPVLPLIPLGRAALDMFAALALTEAEAGAFAHGQAPRRSRAQLTQWAAEAGYAPQAAPEEETPPIAAVSPSGEVLGLLRIDGTRLRTVLVF